MLPLYDDSTDEIGCEPDTNCTRPCFGPVARMPYGFSLCNISAAVTETGKRASRERSLKARDIVANHRPWPVHLISFLHPVSILRFGTALWEKSRPLRPWVSANGLIDIFWRKNTRCLLIAGLSYHTECYTFTCWRKEMTRKRAWSRKRTTTMTLQPGTYRKRRTKHVPPSCLVRFAHNRRSFMIVFNLGETQGKNLHSQNTGPHGLGFRMYFGSITTPA